MKDEVQDVMSSGSIGKEHFDYIVNRLRSSELGNIADALESARQKAVSNNSLSDEQKEERIIFLGRVGEECLKKQPDNRFFARLQDLFVTNTQDTTPGIKNIIAFGIGGGIAQLILGVAQIIRDIDWGSIDIGDIDFS